MGFIDKNLNRLIRPHNAKDRNYAIFGKKLTKQDSEFFNNFTNESINKQKKNLKFFFSVLAISFIIFLITIISPEEYWSIMMLLTLISLISTFFIYLFYFIPYIVIGLYEHSWIKLLESKGIIPKISFLQKIKGRSTSLVYPKVKSYLETSNLSSIITEDDIKSVAPLSQDLEKIIKEHVGFDNSVIKFDEE